MSGLGPWRKFVLAKPNPRHRIPRITNVTRGAPKISTNVRAPLPHVKPAILAKAVNKRTLGRQQRVTHFLIDRGHLLVRVESPGATPVVLQIVDSPCRIGASVLFFVPITPFITGARVWPRRGIDSQLQSLFMYIVRERFHIRKLLVGLDISLRVAGPFPGVVNVDVNVTRLFHTVAGHRISNAAYGGIIHATCKFVPAVPTHRRSLCKSVIRNFVKCWWLNSRRQGTFTCRSSCCNHLREGCVGPCASANV